MKKSLFATCVAVCVLLLCVGCSKEDKGLSSLEGTAWLEQTSDNNPDKITFDSPTVCRYGFISSTNGDFIQEAKGTYEFSKGRVEFTMKYKTLFGNVVEFDYAIIEGDTMTVYYNYDATNIIPLNKSIVLKRVL